MHGPAQNGINRDCVVGGAALGALGVTLGAFGAHVLKAHVSADALGWWHTAVEYQMWHALALLVIGMAGVPGTRSAALLLGLGALVFSGSLYAMTLGGPHWLGAITPLGGLGMIAGWILLAWRTGRKNQE